ncbi:CRISPR-associated endonuclease Cas2 [Candidatus Uhrbacteria bacterium RIFCSPLOWO2_01_FULL_47_24]|uniref:CRISPR-associated endonuclease Cas2 n=1 Tax=Candidatus Uhrbacteria bacterium RIFCSPLOWO2_01_FULL_47_24 TaxID=1802401 RepID=A0A1F7UQQ9_9BACT|nr:MAG: CRISPR-associated endonuclease Cas2 [Candidatus Uhrbacteria bacterium RIFCSPHIGHO2_01_FULL_47_11]OGL68269.1 MAG: CRISPR-associated endonuclease Cas2 [Candidatus Uhrbacteria bacterium RIFCSPHIGHO2_02_FULL_46_47]OGL77000.1 MAG: CRISPR-associated endonuclease Cas2 [Candidatus Uhrbacteria bacterium RIFCSPHIGHO2_12_FULL_47_11]OGL80007.1 MAG: CRISPR-associated endonuclease Cas2 [Candidatus Uhrbacteria bacterium RIFCSPLOWO2_01_FULL_47_24]OGL85205.1 MAG: CRISPR-associated endonuclease Cas2 [Can
MGPKLTKVQTTLLELLAAYKDIDDALASYRPLYLSLKYKPTYFIKKGHRRAKKEQTQFRKHLDYLKSRHYIEMKKEGEEQLVRLTTKAKYEILRLQFVLHMRTQRKRGWDRKWRLVLFDVPEIQKKYRDFLRKLMRANGFRMWQLSVWVSPYNPEPHLSNVLRYLRIEKHYELIEVDCAKCSPRLLQKFAEVK